MVSVVLKTACRALQDCTNALDEIGNRVGEDLVTKTLAVEVTMVQLASLWLPILLVVAEVGAVRFGLASFATVRE